jgi:hypothetical protein
MRATWKPHEKHGRLTKQSDLPDSVFAFPKERKEPLTDASHVRNAIARFNQTEDTSSAERDLAYANIKKAAKYYGVDMTEKSRRDLDAPTRKKAARKKTTRKKATSRKRPAARKKTARKKATRHKKTVRKKKAR